MTTALHRLAKRLVGATLSLFVCLSLLLAPIGTSAQASSSSMTGDYQKDTVQVVRDLQRIIDIPKDEDGQSEAKSEAVRLITDYISRYRNRSQVNGTMSFTTMQTALNSMAGHYKTFKNRPLPESLKERLNTELSKAEKLAMSDR